MQNSDFVSNEEIINYIDVAKKELDDQLVAAYGQDYFATSATFSATVNADGVYSLSTVTSGTFYKLVGVDINSGSAGWVDMEPFTFKERNNYKTQGVQPWLMNTSEYRYRIVGDQFYIRPVPTNALSMRLWWTPQTVALTQSTQMFSDVNGWSEYVVIRAAISCKDKEESDTSVLERDLARMQMRIDGMKTNRDTAAPLKVVQQPEDILFPWWMPP
jgi:hypothetical protein